MTKLRVAVVLFDGFQLLDAMGPIDLLGMLDFTECVMVGPQAAPVKSTLGSSVVADVAYQDFEGADLLLVPGGIGSRQVVKDKAFLEWLAQAGRASRYVASVCTGSGILAAAGLLDGYRATSNKLAFDWAESQGPHVQWERRARWVEDRDRWTSSGVTAGMDMAIAFISHMYGQATAEQVCTWAEYRAAKDSTEDPFYREA